MLDINIVSDNLYFRYGIHGLIQDAIKGHEDKTLYFTFCVTGSDNRAHTLIFRDFMVSVNLRSPDCKSDGQQPYLAVHIPFVCQLDKWEEIVIKIKRIILIARMTRDDFLKDDIFKNIGIRRHSQLSVSETTIMYLTGEGKDINEISDILKRSERTVSTHYRNAMSKMGMKSRAMFYRYASQIAHFDPETEVMTVCL